VRLRILNASNARIYHFRFEDGRAFHQVASEGGLLQRPNQVSTLTLAPAQRVEIVVDFSNGATARLLSAPDDNNPMGGGMMARMMGGGSSTPEAVADDGAFEVMRFDAIAKRPDTLTTLPTAFASAPTPMNADPVRRRVFDLNMHVGGGMMMGGMMGINDQSMDMDRIDVEMAQGEAEIWEIRANEMAHPFHIHGTSFQVLTVNDTPVDFATTGLKDVALANSKVELLVQFNRKATKERPYMYHCHILEHEDAGMMGQFTVS
jgi:FtsP/CotA-like multicopper oxidase with cupredoxin domain